MFTLDERLRKDTVEVASLGLSLVLLMNERSYPWLILVPGRVGLREALDLGPSDRSVLMEEIALASEVLKGLFSPDKINIGALGNVVPQLHVHVIGRKRGDKAWPGPVWGAHLPEPYTEEELLETAERIRSAFKERLRG